MSEHRILCPQCKEPLRHRGVTNLRYCANPKCPNFNGIPPISVPMAAQAAMWQAQLAHAMSPEVWGAALNEGENERCTNREVE